MNRWVGSAQRLDTNDIRDAAAALGVQTAALTAILAVEARGSGFDSLGRVIILYEPHVFYRQLAALPRATGRLNAAQAAGLAYPRWGACPYPRGQDAQYERLEAAVEINRESALRACSWGMGQILGENHALVGFSSADLMVEAAKQSEVEQFAMMLRFLINKKLIGALRCCDWLAVERGYNGAGAGGKWAAKLHTAFLAAGGIYPQKTVSMPSVPKVPIPVYAISDADRLNEAELNRLHSQPTADDLNTAELARIKNLSR